MTGVAKLFDGHILDKSGEEIFLNDQKYSGKVIGLYFSANWCPPCRHFTPILIEFYNKYHQEKNFEIIFLSSDQDEESFDQYFKDMPWWTLDYKEQEKRKELSTKFKILGTPTLVLLDGDSGEILSEDSREFIQIEDQYGENFPWNTNIKKKKCLKTCILM